MGISFLSPFFISAAFLFGLGIWRLYRTRGDGTDRIVSTIALLRKFKRTPLSKKDPKLPLRFFIECLIGLLLSLIIAGLSFHHKQQKALIVMDVSLSTEVKVEKEKTFQDVLRKSVNDFFSNLDFASQVDFIDTENRSLKIDIDENFLKENIVQSKNPHRDDLSELLSNISVDDYDTIFIASDKEVVLRKFSGILKNTNTLQLLPKENIFFDGEYIRNISQREVSGTIDNSSVTLASNSQLKYENKKTSNGLSSFVKFNAQHWEDDRLERDNQIEALTDKPSIEIMQDDQRLLDYSGLPKGYVPSKDSSNSKEKIQNQIKLLSHDAPIEKILIGKANQNILIEKTKGNTIEGPFSWWNDEGILLRYLSPSLVSKVSAVEITCPSWMSVDLKISGKEVLCHGKQSGNTVVLSGLSLVPFGEAKSRFFDILTLNIFQFVFNKEKSKNPLIEESLLERNQVIIEGGPEVTSPQSILDDKKLVYFGRIIIAIVFLLLLLDLLYFLRKRKYFGRLQ